MLLRIKTNIKVVVGVKKDFATLKVGSSMLGKCLRQ